MVPDKNSCGRNNFIWYFNPGWNDITTYIKYVYNYKRYNINSCEITCKFYEKVTLV
jgi:hypothetical protein